MQRIHPWCIKPVAFQRHFIWSQARQTGAGAPHWTANNDCTLDEPNLPRSARTFVKITE